LRDIANHMTPGGIDRANLDGFAFDLIDIAARFEATTRATQPEAALREALEVAHALKEATDLAVGLHARHYSHVKQWKPFPDLRGIISQIDNMTAGLIRPPIDAVTGKERS
jgi:hypothetical protein